MGTFMQLINLSIVISNGKQEISNERILNDKLIYPHCKCSLVVPDNLRSVA
jgi:hypothetical protein